MTRHLMLAGAAGLALIASTTANAQATAGGAAGAQAGTQTQPTPTSAGLSGLDVQYLLNNGDFVGGMVVNQGHYEWPAVTDEEQQRLEQAANAGRPAATRAEYDQARGNSRDTQGIHSSDLPSPTLSRPLSQPSAPSSAPGSRPTSNFEDGETRAIRATIPAYQDRVESARALVAAAQSTNNPEFVAEAQRFYSVAQNQLNDANAAADMSEQYRGRAFSSEEDAARYLNLRESTMDNMYAGSSGTHVDYFQSAQQNLMDQMRAAHDGVDTRLGGAADPIPLAQKQAFEDASNRSRISTVKGANEVKAAPHIDDDGNSPPGTEARRQYGERPRIAPTAEEMANAARAQSTGTTNHSIDEIPGSPSHSANDQAHAGAAEAGAPHTGAAGAGATAAEDNTPPRPVPTSPDYPTVSAEERARISREAAERRAARDAAANAQAAAERAAQEAAAREAAERAAMVERARINDENHRLFLAAQRRNAQDNAWAQMVRERLGNGAWDAFADGRTVTTLQLESIYAGYDPMRAVPPAMSLSSAGMSLSSVGWSLSLAGTDWQDPALQSLYAAMGYFDYRRNSNPFQSGIDGDPARAAQMAYNAGPFDVRYNRDGRENLESGGYLAASLFDFEDPYLRELTANGLTGLDKLLAQPFNVILTWGANANDLDLHMTGPLGADTNSRFHIYYAATGDLQGQPFAQLIKDCICSSGSEVILTSALNSGGVYRVSVFNFGDQSAGSSNLSNASQAQIQIVRGGKTESVGNGTTITGGKTILTTTVPAGGQGNTWTAVELDPKNGRITVPGRIKQSAGSSSVD